MSKPERQLQKELVFVAGLLKCRIDVFYDFYVPSVIRNHPAMKHPQIIKLFNWMVKIIRESQKKAPYDCVLTTPTRMYALELKAGTGRQKDHQKQRERLINSVNPNAYFVIRKWESKKRGTPLYTNIYDIMQDQKVIKRCYQPDQVIKYFVNM